MQIRKQSIGKLELGVLSSLSDSYMMLPFLVFSSLLTGKSTVVNFFVPVVILYSIQRACLIALRGFGGITNPYRILRGGLLLSLAGAVLLALSPLYRPLLMISALVVGVGLSSVRAMFIPLYTAVTQQDGSLRQGKRIGTGLYLLVMLSALILGKRYLPVLELLFLIYIACAAWILLRFDGDALFGRRKAFDTGKRKPVFFVFGALALLCLLILRQYKQSGVSMLIWLTPAMLVIFVVMEMCRRRKYVAFIYQTYWAGAVKSHLLLFSLILHSSVGNTSMASLIYLGIAMGSILSPLLKKPLARRLPGERLGRTAMLLSAALSFLLAAPSQAVNLIGLVLSGAFGSIAAAEAGACYMRDERHVPLERALVRFRVHTAGSIMQQLAMFFIIYLLGELGIHQNLLGAYAAGTPDPNLSLLLRTAGLILSAGLLLSALLIVRFTGKQRSANE
ncbi:MAG: hypothetical protein SOY94_08770 [Candidatus Limiplasma sp.]|nr:hypothetical protein [Candidatus Limiplasma sp.]